MEGSICGYCINKDVSENYYPCAACNEIQELSSTFYFERVEEIAPQSLPPSERVDAVNHPANYTAGSIEVIDIIESVVSSMDLTPLEAVLTGQVLKYICRWKNKGGYEDLKKCSWYLKRLIKKEKE